MKEYLKKQYINARGKRSSKKLLIIESDDWGSIRIPNKKVQEYLINEKLIQPTDPFSAFDCLENADDYQILFEVLKNHKDRFDNHPVLTANMVMANPDFDKIKASNYKHFFFQPFSETYKSYYPSSPTFEALMNGVKQKLLFPQFHAREHLNATLWLQRLQDGDAGFLKAFEKKCFAIDDKSDGNNRANLMASYDYQNDEDLIYIQDSIQNGLDIFEQTFGFRSKTSIAPCYVWNNNIEKMFHENGVAGIQSSYVQQCNKDGKHERIWQKMGKVNKLNQKYFIRNVLFEPALNPNINWVEKALESIAIAFFWGKPAIISSHRINYVASLSNENRTNTLQQLDELLQCVLKRWPDIEFINSEQLLILYS